MPLPTDARSTSGFSEFPDRTGTIPPKRRPFYLHWVVRLLARLEKESVSDALITVESVKLYLNELSRQKEIRQVQRAFEALPLRLYRYYQSTTQPPLDTTATVSTASAGL